MQNPRNIEMYYKIDNTLQKKFAQIINEKVKLFINYNKKQRPTKVQTNRNNRYEDMMYAKKALLYVKNVKKE